MITSSVEGESPSASASALPGLASSRNCVSPRDSPDSAIATCLDRSRLRSKSSNALQSNLRSPRPASERSYEQEAYGYTTAARYQVSPIDGVEALRQAALQSDRQRSIQRSLNPVDPGMSLHAAPVSPLRERDIVALADWFDSEAMPEIEADVDRCLLVLWPAPCWEDDPLEFLPESI